MTALAAHTPIAADAFAEIADFVRRYELARAAKDRRAMGEMQAPVYHLKHSGGEAVHAVSGGDAHVFEAPARSLSQVQLCFDQLAIARLEHWRSGVSWLLFLLRGEGGAWRAVAEAAGPAGPRPARFDPDVSAADVLETLGAYYRAVRGGDAETIARIFDEAWHMKNNENGAIVCEDKAAFIERIKPGPLPGYDDDRQIADIQIMNGALAYMRVDKPSTPSTTVFALFRVNGRWLISDKIWADGRLGAPTYS